MSNLNKIEHIYRGRIVSLDVANATFPDGRVAPVEIVRHPGGAAAVALDDDGRICLLRQYRPVFDQWLWELPAGKLDAGESPASTARRELEEEAGLRAARWDTLGRSLPSPGVFGEILHLFLARELSAAPAAPEEHELFEVHWFALDDAVSRSIDGDIVDAKTVIGLFRTQAFLAGKI